MFLPDHGIAALLHFFRKCCTINTCSPRGLKGAKKEKNLLQNIRKHKYTYVHFLIIYNLITQTRITQTKSNFLGISPHLSVILTQLTRTPEDNSNSSLTLPRKKFHWIYTDNSNSLTPLGCHFINSSCCKTVKPLRQFDRATNHMLPILGTKSIITAHYKCTDG